MTGRSFSYEGVDVLVVDDVEMLLPHAKAWQILAQDALETNVFYEPKPLLLALQHLSRGRDWRVVLLHRDNLLIGMVPLRRHVLAGITGGMVLELLRYRHSFLHTPLLDRHLARPAIDAWLRWLRQESGAALVLCRGMTADGPVRQLLDDAQAGLGGAQVELDRYQRPLLVPGGDVEAYMAQAVRGDRRRETRRQRRLLEAQGTLSFCRIGPDEDVAAWIDGFLALEAKGWKGKNGSALACSDDGTRFFRTLITDLHGSGQAMLYGLRLDERWIAMTSHFRAAPPHGAAYAFKTAYDEELRALAPGIQLEIEIVRRLHGRPAEIAWVDSCTTPENALIGMLWRDRRTVASHILAVPGIKGRLALTALRIGRKARSMRTKR